ncbi:hypothetical protein P170DRAFT_358815 [Aspergillus steynii IBT 23096]|uniref:DNA-directed RNA polymerase subunit n=1 Tax=Aspergillus steynii IBT 23096 TaxID=1392250 RepID=A0A2I2G9N7_9EURO|nr:uncharacterized protein P170DRAFT_358815 [Aspergillus steynii IBT 23096]PLB49600.1 hypothetical protein P170DRAFT_358815 [Aspergillus steynii IBT 23096]
MAVDEMEIDSNPTSHPVQKPEKERKRKHKTKDSSSPSKKKRKHDANLIADKSTTHEKKSKKSSKGSKKSSSSKAVPAAAPSTPDSPYTLTTATLYLPLSPISISPTHALASLLAEHLSPLILTYYAPLQGVVLAYSNASISSTHPAESKSAFTPNDPNPQPLTLARSAGEYGVLYVYLTATFLVFRPQRGQVLEGWVNVQSEGFLGAVVLNLFSVGVERKRLPSDWKWVPPGAYGEEGEGEETANSDADAAKTKSQSQSDDDSSEPSAAFDPEKEHFKPVALASDANPLLDDPASTEVDESAAAEGYFRSVSGHRVRGTVRFRVVDVDVIPGSERDRGFMSIEGTMLTPDEEAQVVEDERNGVMAAFPGAPRRSSSLPIRTDSRTAMSGALPDSSSTAAEPEPEPESQPAAPEPEPEPEQASPTKKSSKSKKKEKEKK